MEAEEGGGEDGGRRGRLKGWRLKKGVERMEAEEGGRDDGS